MEFGRWVGTQFFPSPRDFEKAIQKGSLCLASKTRTLGDALMAAAVARKLKEKHPHLKIQTYNRAFNPIVTRHHPAFSGTAWFPRAMFGDDCNFGSGHLIQLKERWFDLEVSTDPRPEIFLSPEEKHAAEDWLVKRNLKNAPLLMIHPWGHTWTRVLSPEDWADWIREYRESFRIIQIGVQGQKKIDGVTDVFFASKNFSDARLLFALIQQATAFVGVNSGPMHVAKSFNVPSLIVIQEGEPEEIFRRRREHPYYLKGNQTLGFLYESNSHFCLKTQNPSDLKSMLKTILNSVLRRDS